MPNLGNEPLSEGEVGEMKAILTPVACTKAFLGSLPRPTLRARVAVPPLPERRYLLYLERAVLGPTILIEYYLTSSGCEHNDHRDTSASRLASRFAKGDTLRAYLAIADHKEGMILSDFHCRNVIVNTIVDLRSLKDS